jgi:hypothetical protein
VAVEYQAAEQVQYLLVEVKPIQAVMAGMV